MRVVDWEMVDFVWALWRLRRIRKARARRRSVGCNDPACCPQLSYPTAGWSEESMMRAAGVRDV